MSSLVYRNKTLFGTFSEGLYVFTDASYKGGRTAATHIMVIAEQDLDVGVVICLPSETGFSCDLASRNEQIG